MQLRGPEYSTLLRGINELEAGVVMGPGGGDKAMKTLPLWVVGMC